MRPMRWVGDVDQSEFEHACQSALSLNYPYANDLCRQFDYDLWINIMILYSQDNCQACVFEMVKHAFY